jgi:hypothetical protein
VEPSTTPDRAPYSHEQIPRKDFTKIKLKYVER